ncbi:hypothetical protein FUAX_10000 [Fulvitalea axinellae]|uniref:Replication protein n=1 Tax=Fulvitalea axinellae TaxID=1182444 RepID=A0AAU9CKN0_9BACT|nr:hypothetical protein FUAX_10000 [Fulvitalea axinellae]
MADTQLSHGFNPRLLLVDPSKALKRLKDRIDSINDSYDSAVRRKKKIKLSVRRTAERTLMMFIPQLNGAIRKGEVPHPGDLPAFETKNASLASEADADSKTIYNHRKRLSEAGIFTSTALQGRSGIRIRFNPEILWEKDTAELVRGFALSPSKPENSAPERPSRRGHRENFPTLVPELSCTSENSNRAVDKCGTASPSDALLRESDFLAHPKSKNSPTEPQAQGEETGRVPPAGHVDKSGEKRRKDRLVTAMARDIWKYAWQTLWAGKIMPEFQREKALRNLGRLLFNRYYENREYATLKGRALDKSLEQYHDEITECLDYQRACLETIPGTWIPDKPEWYFYEGNARNGFSHTRMRFERYRLRKQKREHLSVFEQVKREARTYRRDKGRHKDKTPTEMYRWHRQKIADTGQEWLMREFGRWASRSPYVRINTQLWNVEPDL